MPYSSSAEEKAPSRKYFMAASVERGSCFLIPHRMYRLRDMSSIPKNTMMKSLAEAMSIIPVVEKSSRL